MRLFDSHCHFESTDEAEVSAILQRARAAGVEKILAVGGSPLLNGSARLARRIATDEATFPKVLIALGADRDQLDLLLSPEIFDGTPCAVGEIGLDYFYSPETRREQMKLFAAQLEIARVKDLPVIIHTREAAEDTRALLTEIPSRGIIHCFTGTPAEAKTYLDFGLFVSISGIVTFKSADNVRETARFIPDDRILIETDSPYLAPVPMRGNPNEPAFVRHTCEFLASLRGQPPDEFAALTFANAERILG